MFENNLKKWSLLAAALVLSLSTAQCSILGLEDDDDNDDALALGLLAGAAALAGGGVSTLEGTITGTVTTGTTVRLAGTVKVDNGAILIIPAGATIFGDTGSALFVRNGGRIIAQGTAAAPITFTSAQNDGSKASGDWGGIVLIGDAPTNQGSSSTEGSGADAETYGGSGSTDSADSSGILQYVRIQFAGFAIATGDELNCLSLYTVGTGTTLDHVQCHLGLDDAYEWFGGTVNGTHLISTGTGDDDFDIDEGYSGKLQYLIGHKYGTNASAVGNDPRGFEWNGSRNGTCTGLSTCSVNNGGSFNSAGTVKAANFTLIGSKNVFQATVSNQDAMHLREGLQGNVTHGLLWGYENTGGTGANIDCEDGATITYDNIVGPTGTTNGNSSNGQCATPGNLQKTLTSAPTAADSDNSSAGYLNTTAAGTSVSSALGGLEGFFTDTSNTGATPDGTDWTVGWTTFPAN